MLLVKSCYACTASHSLCLPQTQTHTCNFSHGVPGAKARVVGLGSHAVCGGSASVAGLAHTLRVVADWPWLGLPAARAAVGAAGASQSFIYNILLY